MGIANLFKRSALPPAAPAATVVRLPPIAADPSLDLRFIPREFEATADDGTPIYGRGWVIHDGDDSALSEDDHRVRDAGIVICNVAGVTFRPASLQMSCFNPGREVRLVKEPQNPVDKKAIAVFDARRRHHLGYVPKGLTWRIHPLLDSTPSIGSYVWWDSHKTDCARCGVKIIVLPAARAFVTLADFELRR